MEVRSVGDEVNLCENQQGSEIDQLGDWLIAPPPQFRFNANGRLESVLLDWEVECSFGDAQRVALVIGGAVSGWTVAMRGGQLVAAEVPVATNAKPFQSASQKRRGITRQKIVSAIYEPNGNVLEIDLACRVAGVSIRGETLKAALDRGEPQIRGEKGKQGVLRIESADCVLGSEQRKLLASSIAHTYLEIISLGPFQQHLANLFLEAGVKFPQELRAPHSQSYEALMDCASVVERVASHWPENSEFRWLKSAALAIEMHALELAGEI